MKPKARELKLHVLVTPSNGMWFAQCVEHDICAQANTPSHLKAVFHQTVCAELVMSKERGDKTPLAGVPSAPVSVRKLFFKSLANRLADDVKDVAKKPKATVGCESEPIFDFAIAEK